METLPLKNSCFFQLSAFERFQRESKGWSAVGVTLTLGSSANSGSVPEQWKILQTPGGNQTCLSHPISACSSNLNKGAHLHTTDKFLHSGTLSKSHAVSMRMLPEASCWCGTLPHTHSVLDHPTLAGRKEQNALQSHLLIPDWSTSMAKTPFSLPLQGWHVPCPAPRDRNLTPSPSVLSASGGPIWRSHHTLGTNTAFKTTSRTC